MKNNEIAFVARKGKKFDSEYFFVRCWYDDALENSKFAFAVSLKVDKKAVVRNRIKRVLKAAVYELNNETFFKRGKYLFVVKSNALSEMKSPQVSALLQKSFESSANSPRA